MDLPTHRTKGILTVGAWRELDSENALAFQDALQDSVGEGDQGVVVDCKKLCYISSAGLRALLAVSRALSRRKTPLVMCELDRQVQRVFAITGFDRVIPTYHTREEAVAAIRR